MKRYVFLLNVDYVGNEEQFLKEAKEKAQKVFEGRSEEVELEFIKIESEMVLFNRGCLIRLYVEEFSEEVEEFNFETGQDVIVIFEDLGLEHYCIFENFDNKTLIFKKNNI